MSTKIFLTGATGYIGGGVLSELLKHPNYTISALARREDQAAVLRQLGVTPVLGSLEDSEVLYEASRSADVVINTANSDHIPAIHAIVKGLKAKKDPKALLIHTSGTSVISYEDITTVPFDDEDIERIHRIPLNVVHRAVDTFIFDNSNDFKAIIVAPSTVNGVGSGPFKKTSIQTIYLAKESVLKRKAGYFQKDHEVVWTNVHIADLADLYVLVLEGALSGKIQKYGKDGGWYFGIAAEHTWIKIAQSLGTILYKKGLVDTPEATPFGQDILDKYGPIVDIVFGKDSRGVSNRGRKLGWNPSRPNVYETLETEIDEGIKSGEIAS